MANFLQDIFDRLQRSADRVVLREVHGQEFVSKTGAELLGRAAPLADALASLERGAQAIPMNVNAAEASLYAVNPLPRRGLATLFMTHPPIAERIRRLRALDSAGQVARLAAA